MANLLRLVACLFVLLSFNVFAVDTDGDGFSDADEATLGTDPNDPTSPLENKLTASDGAEDGYFGNSVSIDGDTAFISDFYDDDNGQESGSVYVYVQSNGIWSEQQKLTASDGASNDYFGNSVSIDGDTAVIGAYADDDNGGNSGSVYVYLRSDGIWSEQAKLTASDGAADDLFGDCVSISGNTVVVGASQDDDNGSQSGSVYVFTLSNGVWTEQQKLTPSDATELDLHGRYVSISGDTVVVGDYGSNVNGTRSGSAYIYKRTNGVWSEQQKLIPSDGAAGDTFGIRVSIDGDTAVIGAGGDDDNGENSGSVYVYVQSNGIWSEQAKLTASDGAAGDHFGYSVSIDGDTAVIGANGDDGDNNNLSSSGSAYIFTRSNGVWAEQQKLTASDGAYNDAFGASVSISGDTVVIGLYHIGSSAYIFPLGHQDTLAIITGATSANIDIGGFGFGTLIATDVDGLTDGSYFTISTPPVNGQALVNATTGNWIYTANNSYTGSDPFTVTVTDDLGGTTDQVVSITITSPDSDGDGAYDHQDNCPSVSNADQANLDGDTFGDACDSDIDGDGVDNILDAFPNDSTESSDSDSDNVGDNTDNCINAANFDQANLDGDGLGDACDPDMDGDGVFNVVELRFGGNATDDTDASISQDNIVTFSETAPADSDLDGIIDSIETAAGTSNSDPSDGDQAELSALEALGINKQVPAMSGIGLLALGLSMLGLGAVRLRK